MALSELKKPTLSVGVKNKRSYKREFLYEANTDNIGPQQVLAAVGNAGYITGISVYSYLGDLDTAAKLTSISIKGRDGKKRLFDVSLSYETSNNPDEEGQQQDDPSPLSVPASISVRGVLVKETVEEDANGDRLQNTAFHPFPYETTMDKPTAVMSITKNFALFEWGILNDYLGAINSSPFKGFPAKQVRCTSIGATREIIDAETGEAYAKMSFEFEFFGNPYNPTKLQNTSNTVLTDWEVNGTTVKFPDSPKKWDPRLNSGQGGWGDEELPGPVYLDGDGYQIKDPSAEDPNDLVLEFDLFREADFNNLGLD